MKKKILYVFVCILLAVPFTFSQQEKGKWLFLDKADIGNSTQNTEHFKTFGKYTSGYNLDVLKAIDLVQKHAMDGGGYFIGIDSIPTESPVGYELKLFNHSLINPPRKTSYCSGSSYSVFIEALNLILKDKKDKLDQDRIEALRMQEPDGGRREDWVKFWGIWNADGFGSEYALVQYSKMGKIIKPEEARPGDFINISWKSGIGHSVVFLGWYIDENNKKYIAYWSSQKSTNGFGDQMSSLTKVKSVKVVRLTAPENLFNFNINETIDKDVPGDEVTF